MVTGAGTEPDADLAAAAGAGDERASDELYRRHHAAVLGYARGLVRDQYLAEDLASEAFARTLAALRQGRGPREACRPYLYTVVRNAAVDWARSDRRTVVTDQVAEWADGPPEELPDVDELDALVRAFRSLPERWQTVLWHTVIEDEPVQRVAEILGMEAGAVAQLSFRAREGLRQAYLAASCEGHPDCAEYTAQLAASVRRPGRRRGRALRRHLESCERCRRTAEEMADLNGRLRRALPIGAVLLAAPAAPFGGLAPAASFPAWAVPAGVAAAAAAGVLAVLLGTGGGGEPPGATRAAPPSTTSASPAGTAAPDREAVAPDHASGKKPAGRGRPGGPNGAPAAADPAGAGPYRVRNTTLQSCLAPDGTNVVQRACSGTATTWRRKNTSGGFTLTSVSTGKCMARGQLSAGPMWEGGQQYSVVMASCGGANQVWKLVQFGGVYRLANGDGWFLQASWSGLQPVTLKPSSYAGMAAQGWAVN
ncbi:sigma-70 family RNA polymerase sigma factor [Actinomadura nitritigenes]|uniref:sigma-70 family RNA polymerase sigma factor n=1 Tax=Actinomadura nitritigenes TaxID=134602 RepID=UPI003D8D52D3